MTVTITAPVTRMLHSLPAAAHIRALRHVGIVDSQITAQARLTTQQLRRAARGELIGWDIERRILAVPIPTEAALYEHTTSVGARRRLRALQSIGWPLQDLADACGWPLHKTGTMLGAHPIYVVDHLMVCALYDQRWTWNPEDHGIPADEADHARLVATIAQCASPLAWDDETIDDPKARPRAVRPAGHEHFGAADPAAALRALDGDRVRLSGKTNTLAIAYAARYLDMPFDVIAERLGMDPVAVKRSWERIKARARKRGEKWVDAPRFTTNAVHEAGRRPA